MHAWFDTNKILAIPFPKTKSPPSQSRRHQQPPQKPAPLSTAQPLSSTRNGPGVYPEKLAGRGGASATGGVAEGAEVGGIDDALAAV